MELLHNSSHTISDQHQPSHKQRTYLDASCERGSQSPGKQAAVGLDGASRLAREKRRIRQHPQGKGSATLLLAVETGHAAARKVLGRDRLARGGPLGCRRAQDAAGGRPLQELGGRRAEICDGAGRVCLPNATVAQERQQERKTGLGFLQGTIMGGEVKGGEIIG